MKEYSRRRLVEWMNLYFWATVVAVILAGPGYANDRGFLPGGRSPPSLPDIVKGTE